ncbi:unnamed protein product [Diamesa serratosioi]
MSLADISCKFTEQHLNEIIIQSGGVKYTSWEFDGDGSKKGDSYLSEVYKLAVHGLNDKNQEMIVNVIIKATPKNIARRKTFRSSDFFRNEINFYNYVLKGFEEFQSVKKDAKRPFVEVPKCFVAYCDGENDFLVLENLNDCGYSTIPRNNAMDIHICRLIMQTLGRFHGVSFVIRDQSPELFDNLTAKLEETYYAPRLKNWYIDFMKTQIKVGLDAVTKEYGGTVIEENAKKFLVEGDLYDKMCKLTHTRNQYSVIGHGDTWVPNFLIHSEMIGDKDVPVSAKRIDFQLARFASPAIDLSFFFYSCTSQELREEYFDDLIKTYHESLCCFVKDFGSNPDILFPFSALQEELKTSFRFGTGMAIESIPFSLLEDHEAPDMDIIQGEEAVPIQTIWIIKPITNKDGRKRLADVFKHATEQGYLD